MHDAMSVYYIDSTVAETKQYNSFDKLVVGSVYDLNRCLPVAAVGVTAAYADSSH
jgi:hypothetical protein